MTVLSIDHSTEAVGGSRRPASLPRIGATFESLGVPAALVAVLAEAGITDLDQYATQPGRPLIPDFFVD